MYLRRVLVVWSPSSVLILPPTRKCPPDCILAPQVSLRILGKQQSCFFFKRTFFTARETPFYTKEMIPLLLSVVLLVVALFPSLFAR